MQVLVGDVTQPRLGLDEDGYAGLVAAVTHIIHMAADLRLNAPIAELRRTNLQGTEHVLELADAAQASHRFRAFPMSPLPTWREAAAGRCLKTL